MTFSTIDKNPKECFKGYVTLAHKRPTNAPNLNVSNLRDLISAYGYVIENAPSQPKNWLSNLKKLENLIPSIEPRLDDQNGKHFTSVSSAVSGVESSKPMSTHINGKYYKNVESLHLGHMEMIDKMLKVIKDRIIAAIKEDPDYIPNILEWGVGPGDSSLGPILNTLLIWMKDGVKDNNKTHNLKGFRYYISELDKEYHDGIAEVIKSVTSEFKGKLGKKEFSIDILTNEQQADITKLSNNRSSNAPCRHFPNEKNFSGTVNLESVSMDFILSAFARDHLPKNEMQKYLKSMDDLLKPTGIDLSGGEYLPSNLGIFQNTQWDEKVASHLLWHFEVITAAAVRYHETKKQTNEQITKYINDLTDKLETLKFPQSMLQNFGPKAYLDLIIIELQAALSGITSWGDFKQPINTAREKIEEYMEIQDCKNVVPNSNSSRGGVYVVVAGKKDSQRRL